MSSHLELSAPPAEQGSASEPVAAEAAPSETPHPLSTHDSRADEPEKPEFAADEEDEEDDDEADALEGSLDEVGLG
ncbi:poly(A) polymerase, partial [Pyxidicoccus sp. 3LG]